MLLLFTMLIAVVATSDHGDVERHAVRTARGQGSQESARAGAGESTRRDASRREPLVPSRNVWRRPKVEAVDRISIDKKHDLGHREVKFYSVRLIGEGVWRLRGGLWAAPRAGRAGPVNRWNVRKGGGPVSSTTVSVEVASP
jgi:hypothetical protein